MSVMVDYNPGNHEIMKFHDGVPMTPQLKENSTRIDHTCHSVSTYLKVSCSICPVITK